MPILKIRAIAIRSSCFLIFFFTFLHCFSYSYAQPELEDVVYLKNGSIIHGIITEQIPGKSITIETKDENVFVFKMEEINKISKEKIKSNNNVKSKNEKIRELEPYPLAKTNIILNIGGFLTKGPQVFFDFRLSRYFMFGFNVRVPYLGLQSSDNIGETSYSFGDNTILTDYISGGVNLKLLPGSTKNRFFISLLCEFGSGHMSLGKATYWADTLKELPNFTLSPLFNFGYRFRFVPFSLNTGIFLGPILSLDKGFVRPLYILDIGFGIDM